MNVTIITDASHCPRTGASGCGYWVACDRGKKGASVPYKMRLAKASEAELLAILVALDGAIANKLVMKGDRVLMQSDCTGAIAKASCERDPITPMDTQAVLYIRRLIVQYELTVEFRHVKAHKKSLIGSRYTVIQLVDQKAKAAMRECRATINKADAIIEALKKFLNDKTQGKPSIER